MVYTVFDVVEMAIIITFFIFHILMLIFLIRIRNSNPVYRTYFYTVFILVTVVDLLSVINNFFGAQLHKFGGEAMIQWYLEADAFLRIAFFNSGFAFCLQCFYHLSTVVNRYWIIKNILKHQNLNEYLMKLARHTNWIFPLISAGLGIRKVFGEATYVQKPDGGLTYKFVDPAIQEYQATAGTIVVVITGSLTFLFQVLTLVAYRDVLKSGRYVEKNMNRDVRIMFQALIMLILQMLLALCQTCVYIGAKFNVPTLLQTGSIFFVYVDDAFCLIGSVVLVIVSKYVRQDFFKFYFPWIGESQTIKISCVHYERRPNTVVVS